MSTRRRLSFLLQPSSPPWRCFRSLVNGAEAWLPPGDGQKSWLRIKKQASLRIPGRSPGDGSQAPSTITTKKHRLDYQSCSTKTLHSSVHLCSDERKSDNLHLQESLSNLWDYPDVSPLFSCITCLWIIKRSEQIVMGGRVHAAEVCTLRPIRGLFGGFLWQRPSVSPAGVAAAARRKRLAS